VGGVHKENVGFFFVFSVPFKEVFVNYNIPPIGFQPLKTVTTGRHVTVLRGLDSKNFKMEIKFLIQQFKQNSSYSIAKKSYGKPFIRKQVYYALRNSYYGKKVVQKQLSTKTSLVLYEAVIQEKEPEPEPEPKKPFDTKNLRTRIRWSYFAFSKEEKAKGLSPSESARYSSAKDGYIPLEEMKKISGMSQYLRSIKIKGKILSKSRGGFHYIVYNKKTKEVIQEISEGGKKFEK